MYIDIEGVKVEIKGVEEEDLNAIHNRLLELLTQPQSRIKNRDAISSAFEFAVQLCPDANASDLWHHVIYREFVRTIKEARKVNDPKQSWVRSSGDAFEIFIQDYYNQILAEEGIRLTALFSKSDSRPALEEMGIDARVGGSKLDISIRDKAGRMIGGIHAKASLAERVSDDVPASLEMMSAGYLSALVTLDVKSFPVAANVSESRAYINRGELGSPTQPSDKRDYIERHGSFDICVSYNARTVPSHSKTPSGKRIFTSRLDGEPDALVDAILSRVR